jgi:hypothetical protein
MDAPSTIALVAAGANPEISVVAVPLDGVSAVGSHF